MVFCYEAWADYIIGAGAQPEPSCPLKFRRWVWEFRGVQSARAHRSGSQKGMKFTERNAKICRGFPSSLPSTDQCPCFRKLPEAGKGPPGRVGWSVAKLNSGKWLLFSEAQVESLVFQGALVRVLRRALPHWGEVNPSKNGDFYHLTELKSKIWKNQSDPTYPK